MSYAVLYAKLMIGVLMADNQIIGLVVNPYGIQVH